jgi:phosphate-selective porin
LRELDRRLGILESVVVGRGHGRGVMERGLGWSPEIKERGFALYSNDGLYRLHLNGGVQADYHGYPGSHLGSDPGTEPSGFVLRRLRPIVDFRIAQDFRGQIMPDLAPRRRSELFNAFIDWDRYEWARVRVGQFKPVMNIENQQGEFDLVFAERSLVQNFALRRDFGVQLTGRVFQRTLRYDFGVFNSNNGAVGSASVPDTSSDSNKLGMGRFMYTPFLLEGTKIFRKLDIGVAAMYGACRESACQQPMLTMGQDRVIFQYQDSVVGNGYHFWLLPQMSWFWGRLGMMSTFVHTWEPKIDRATGRTARLQHQAWMVQGEFALTDDEPAFNRVTPRRPFDGTWESFARAHWGAWTLAARYSEQQLDADTFTLNFGDAGRFARTARGYSVALNWYANREFRFQNIWEHTDFKGANSTYVASRAADMLIFRVTLIY